MCVKVDTRDGKLFVVSPYNPDLPAAARGLSGKWNGSAWVFPEAVASDVKELYQKIYGQWPGEVADLVRVRAVCEQGDWEDKAGIFLLGRCVARAFNRDSGARLGEGVVVREGGFSSGGSMKHWQTQAEDGTVIELLDVPRAKFVPAEGRWTFEIIEEPGDADNLRAELAALEEQRASINARIAAIRAKIDGEGE